MQHPKDIFCDAYAHGYTPPLKRDFAFFRDDTMYQKPYAYLCLNKKQFTVKTTPFLSLFSFFFQWFLLWTCCV